MQNKQILVSGVVVNYYHSEKIKKERTLVFLHGWGQYGISFKKIFELLEKDGISYVSIDLPGFGKTPVVDLRWQIEDYGGFVKDVIEKLELQKPVIIGHSFGGRIAIYLGSYYENISKLVLIGSAGIKPKQNYPRLALVKAGKYIFKLPLLSKFAKGIRNAVSSRDSKSAGSMRHIFLNTISNDLQKYMVKIHTRTLLIWGGKDTETPLDDALTMHAKIKNSLLEVIPEGTHFVYDEFPKEVFQLMKKFLSL